MKKSITETFYNGIRKLNTFCATIAGVILLFVCLSIFVDVVLRYFFGSPTIWITEVSTYLFLYIIFLGTAYALQEDLHIRVTFLLSPFGEKVKRVVNLITSFFALAFTAILMWQSSIMWWSDYEGNWTSPTILNAPYAYIHIAMIIGSFLLLITFLCTMIVEFKGLGSQVGENR